MKNEGFSHIICGSSPFLYRGSIVFAKHYGFHDSMETDFIYDIEFAKAKEIGIDTEKERLDTLYEEDVWTLEKENRIEILQSEITRTESSKKNIILPSQKKIVDENLNKLKTELLELKLERSRVVGQTCESIARQESEIFFILNSIYKDNGLFEMLIPKERHENLEFEEITELVNLYNQSIDCLNDSNIKKIALSQSVQSLVSLSNSAYEFYGKPICQLTFFQSELYIFAKNYSHILSSDVQIPANIISDPEKLEDWYDSVSKSKKYMGENTSLIGATQEDIKELTGGASVLDMDKEIKNRSQNGILSMEEMIKLMAK